MEANTIPENFCNRVLRRISQAFHPYKRSVISVSKRVWQVGADDPRRVIHSMKVGLALSLVSILGFVRPMFHSFGGNAVWAVMTVVLVFEFTVVATLNKGLNRSLATLLAGLLGVGVSSVAELTGKIYERLILAISVFALGRCILNPNYAIMYVIKQSYGVLIFLLTFNFVAISGSSVENILKLAYHRIATIIIGCTLCFVINVFVFPIWAGDDLHDLIIQNLEGLAGSLQEYFVESENGQDSDNDKANFARWEPAHGPFFCRYPWQLYVKVGSVARYSAYCVEAINGLLDAEIQTPISWREYLKMPCIEIGRESASILSELADSIRTRRTINATVMTDRLKAKVEELQNSLRAQPEFFVNTERSAQTVEFDDSTEQVDAATLEGEMQEDEDTKLCEISEEDVSMRRESYTAMEVLHLTGFCALLLETVARLESVIGTVKELGDGAKFKNTDQPVKEFFPPSLTKTTTSLTSTEEMVSVPLFLAANLPTTTTD
eukprot:PITA_08171